MRERLIQEINAKGGYNGQKLDSSCGYSELELESIIEYDDHRCFPEEEYDFSVNYIEDKKGNKRMSTYTMPTRYSFYFKDLEDAKKVGGNQMKKHLQYSMERDIQTEISRRNKITKLIASFPDKFHVVTKYILENDMDKLVEYTERMQRNTVLKLLCILTHKRGLEMGVFSSFMELPKYFEIEKPGLLRILGDMQQAGFFSKEIKKTLSVEESARNIIFDLFNLSLINDRDKKVALALLKDFKMLYPEIFNASEYLDFALVMSILQLIRPVHIRKFIGTYGKDEPRDIMENWYQAVRRTERRSNQYQMDRESKKYFDIEEYIPMVDQQPVELNIEVVDPVPEVPEIVFEQEELLEEVIEECPGVFEQPIFTSEEVFLELHTEIDDCISFIVISDGIGTISWYGVSVYEEEYIPEHVLEDENFEKMRLRALPCYPG
ncbi:MAG: hypothetical protein INQ03_09240 [Candidatus Heimdallarchaeota archaeon]|nr:hypothetical protein [Candidatus Heimdallarchaeota archaeon]